MSPVEEKKDGWFSRFFRQNDDGDWVFVWNGPGDEKAKFEEWKQHVSSGEHSLFHKDYGTARAFFVKALAIRPQDAAVLHKIAKCELQLGMLAQAMRHAERARSLDSVDHEIVLTIIRILHRMGSVAEAMQILNDELLRAPNSYALHYEKGLLLLDQHMVEEAKDAFTKAVHCHDRKAGAHLQLAKIALLDNRTSEAHAEFELALEIDSTLTEAHAGMGDCLIREGRYTEAHERLRTALYHEHDNVYVLTLIGWNYLQQKNYNLAMRSLKDAIRLDPKNLAAHRTMAEVYFAVNKLDEALSSVNRAIQTNDRDYQSLILCAAILRKAGKRDKALERLKEATAVEPSCATWRLLAAVHQDLLHFHEALRCYETALQVDPDCMEAQCGKAGVLCDLSRYDEAQHCYESLIRRNSSAVCAYLGLARCYYLQEQLDDAHAAVEMAVRLDNESVEAHLLYGQILESEGNSTAAIERYGQVLKLDPLNEKAMIQRGALYERGGDYARAIQAFKTALHINADSADAHRYVANTYIHIGRFNAAMVHFEEVLRLRPTDTTVFLTVGAALERAYQPDRALEIYERAVANNPDFADGYYNIGRLANEQGKTHIVYDMVQRLSTLSSPLAERLTQLHERTQSVTRSSSSH